MKWLKALFSAPKALDVIVSSGDKLVFTQEERVDAMREMARVLGPQNLARRAIALTVTGIWSLDTLILTGFTLAGRTLTPDFMTAYQYICTLFGGVLAFYFGIQFTREKGK